MDAARGKTLLTLALFLNIEPDIIYSFVKPLLKKTQGYLKREFDLECQVDNYKAPVEWFKGETQLEPDESKYEISKDLTGVCRLKFLCPVKADNGEYSCRIEKQNLKTATKMSFVGNDHHHKHLQEYWALIMFWFVRIPVQILQVSDEHPSVRERSCYSRMRSGGRRSRCRLEEGNRSV